MKGRTPVKTLQAVTARDGRVCAAADCGRGQYARELCRKHYVRLMKNGDPLVVRSHAPSSFSVAERLAIQARRDGECLVFTGPLDRYGYGYLTVGNKKRGAHRLAFEAHIGPLATGLVVRHACDNRACIEPSHLSAGTHADNQRDKAERGRSTAGESNPASVLSATAALSIYGRVHSGESVASLAREFGVGTSTIGRIKRRESWASVIDASIGAGQ